MQDTVWADDILVARICDLPLIRGKSDWEAEQANARLIAAAPELYAACWAVLNMEQPELPESIVAQLSAAVNKAEAESKLGL